MRSFDSLALSPFILSLTRSVFHSRNHSPTQSVGHSFTLLQKAYPGEFFFFVRVTELLQVYFPAFSPVWDGVDLT